MFLVEVGYPGQDDEIAIVDQTAAVDGLVLDPQVSAEELLALQDRCSKVPAGPEVTRMAVALVRASRPGPDAPDFINDWVAWGGSPRASQFLVQGGKARALLHGRSAVSREDIRALAGAVLGHRILLNFRAEAEGVKPAAIIDRLVDLIDPPSRL
jgi:MoxR-like ATPase